jgi:hypothetical protein
MGWPAYFIFLIDIALTLPHTTLVRLTYVHFHKTGVYLVYHRYNGVPPSNPAWDQWSRLGRQVTDPAKKTAEASELLFLHSLSIPYDCLCQCSVYVF